MSTNGAITFVLNGVEKTTYNHSDSYPTYLGAVILDWLRSPEWNHDDVCRRVQALRMVDQSAAPTAAERKRYARYADPGVSTGSDWYSLLRRTQGDLDAILEAGVACEGGEFPLDSLFCEWVYVIDLDAGNFEIYDGFQTQKPNAGRWVDTPKRFDYWPVNLLVTWPISEARATTSTSAEIMERVGEYGNDSAHESSVTL